MKTIWYNRLPLYVAASFLLGTGCVNSRIWLHQRLATGDTQYDSHRVVYPAKDKANDIEVEILKTDSICTLFLSVHGQPVTSCENDPEHAPVRVKIRDETFTELALLHAGGQRLKISEALQEAILAQLRAGGSVEIELPGYKRKVAAANFPDLIGKLDQTPFFEDAVRLSF